jgi:hypothetical protein
VNDFENKIERSLGCWRWIGAIQRGYGVVHGTHGTKYAHRLSYERFVGPIPIGMALDHLCENRWCVNPDHLEIVTSGENTTRGNLRKEWKNRMARWLETGRWESSRAKYHRNRREEV